MIEYKCKDFYDKMQSLFIGYKMEGKGGFINLMDIRSRYYSKFSTFIQDDIDNIIKLYPDFIDDVFDKLYSFFSMYFSKNGSICFNNSQSNILCKYDKDIMLVWRSQMSYYVKTDCIFRSMLVDIDGHKIFFDVSNIEYKKANEKRYLSYKFGGIKDDGTIVFNVLFTETEMLDGDIISELKKHNVIINDDIIKRAIKKFKRQKYYDFFINKNAKVFLQEQFNIWWAQYFYNHKEILDINRLNQLYIFKDIAYKIIDFISQFEDELVKIWNKPKFVYNSNYVITLDRINNLNLIKKIINHQNIDWQINEWQELGIVDDSFNINNIIENDLLGEHLNKKYEHLPIDTKYFKDIELEILSQFDDLDKSLDGWLIKSENYQALNTILPKFKEKVQTIYIDPPYNTGNDFPYVDRFQDSSWLSLIYDRINIGHDFLRKEGNFYFHIDRYAYYYSRLLFNNIFGDKNFKAEIAWDTSGITGFKPGKNNWVQNINYILHFAKNDEYNFFTRVFVLLEKEEKERLRIGWLDLLYDDEKEKYYVEKWNEKFTREYIETENKKHPVGMVWTDIYSFLFTQVGNNESFFFKTQKPEHLLRRIIQTSTRERDIVLDYFAGIGTSLAVAHKLNRRWLGVDMGEHFNTFYNEDDEKKIGILGRMKIVLSGDQVFMVFGHPRHPQLSRNINYQGGGFFKYYELEQYEESLNNCKYEDGGLFNSPLIKGWQSEALTGYWSGRSPYQEYVFLKDEKMLKALEIDYENDKVDVDLSQIYPNIDIAETLSNLTGKWIKKIRDGEVEFEDGMKINTKDLDYKLIKPLIWW